MSNIEKNILELNSPNETTKIIIDTADGMNVISITYQKNEYIVNDLERKDRGVTYAVPILYPTPNRILNNVFTFEGKDVASKMHGLVRKCPFEMGDIINKADCTSVTGRLSFAPQTELYKGFPYDSTLIVTINVFDNAVEWKYTVENNGSVNLPYSFALHPFFVKTNRTKIKASVNAVMEMNQDCYPSGYLLPPKVQGVNINEITNVEHIHYDHVFCVDDNMRSAEIFYPSFGTMLTLATSEEFGRLVVYTPEHKDFFCVENQTSSTDCHNLHTKGFVEEANLQIVPPNETKSGFIRFNFSEL